MEEDIKRIELGPEIEKSFDNMILEYNNIVTFLNEIPEEKRIFKRIQTKAGTSFDFWAFAHRINAILYKLIYAGRSLEYLQKAYNDRLNSFDNAHPFKILTDERPISEDLVFHTDVLFSFTSSALDISSWILHMTLGTNLPENRVKFDKVIEFLASSKRGSVDPLFTKLKSEIDKGWLSEFDSYRDYVTHYSYILPKRGFRWTAESRMIEVTFFMLPDNPKIFPQKYDKRKELVPYCNDVYIKSINVIRDIFKFTNGLL